MALFSRPLFVLTFFVLVVASCTKPLLIGSDFLEDEKASLDYKDDFGLTFFTKKTDSVIVHSLDVSRQLYTYLCGELNDPVFGKSIAEIYAQPILPTVATDLKDGTLDSVLLELRYDTLGSYGDLTTPVTIEVYRMTQKPDFNLNYYSNQRFDAPALLGSLLFTPKPKDSLTVISIPGDTNKVAPHIRIPLNISLLSDFTLQDSMAYRNLDTFLTFFNGLHIKMSNVLNTMLGFNLVNAVSGMDFFYKKTGDTIQHEFRFVFTAGSVKTVHMEHDYTGTIVNTALSPEPENQYWFFQGLSGVTTTMKVDGLDQLGNVIINEADLEVYCTFPDGDIPDLFPPCNFLVTQTTTDTSIINSVDVNTALFRASGNVRSATYETFFGGVLDQVDAGPPTIFKYSMKITSQIKDIYKGKKENIIYFNPIDKGNVPCRSVIFGPGDPVYAPRLKIYYTAL